jgi:hypothetical protein
MVIHFLSLLNTFELLNRIAKLRKGENMVGPNFVIWYKFFLDEDYQSVHNLYFKLLP